MTTEVLTETQATDAASQAPEGTSDLDEGLALLDALDGKEALPAGNDAEASGDNVPETKTTPDEDEEALVTARAERLAEEKLAQERTQLQEQQRQAEEARQDAERKTQRKQIFDQAAPALRQALEQDGVEPERINGYLQWLAGYNGAIDGHLSERQVQAFRQWAAQTLPESERESFTATEHKTTKDFFEDYKTRLTQDARRGYVSEAKAREEAASRVVAFKKRLLSDEAFRESVLSHVNTPQSRGGSPVANGPINVKSLSPEQVAAMMSDPKQAARLEAALKAPSSAL